MTFPGKLHDFEIFSIEYDQDTYELRLGIRSEQKVSSRLRFKNCQLWDLDPFAPQNVIFEFKVQDAQNYTPTTSIIRGIDANGEPIEYTTNGFEVPEHQLQWAIKNSMKIYTIDPSTGMGGYIIAEDVEWMK